MILEKWGKGSWEGCCKDGSGEIIKRVQFILNLEQDENLSKSYFIWGAAGAKVSKLKFGR
ncbi:MAG: hypothetical protein DBX55_08735 [Verrucomicrobia bacterium]|nr:MAG: hypothetical protein DBX55_08735 [Verrucomicrobiota bacterium]